MKVLVAGDFCPRDRVINKFRMNQYEDVLGEVSRIVSCHDYAIVNEECPILDNKARPITKFCSNLSFSREGLLALRFAGFDCLTLANNHFKDFGEDGVRQTLSIAKSLNFDCVGGGSCLSEAQKILFRNIDNKTLAVINFCEHEFSIATEKSAGSAPLDLPDNLRQIEEARERADFVIVIIHGGHEHYQLPSPRMKKTYRLFIDWGADVVINHHQHCFSGFESYNGKQIFYGLGNFCFDSPSSRHSLWNEGLMLSFNIADNSKYSFEVIPYSQCDDEATVKILDGSERDSIFKRIEELNNIIADDSKLNASFETYCKQRYMEMKLSISPYSNRITKGLCRRGLLPSFNTFKRIVKLRDFVQCESHKDVLDQYLNYMYQEYENK